jgi:hypothetical protein
MKLATHRDSSVTGAAPHVSPRKHPRCAEGIQPLSVHLCVFTHSFHFLRVAQETLGVRPAGSPCPVAKAAGGRHMCLEAHGVEGDTGGLAP